MTLGGNAVPGETTFDLAIVGASTDEESYADVTISGSVTTNGAGEYEGKLTFSGPERQLWHMLSEGAFVQQVDAGADGWTVDDTVYGLVMTEVAAYSTDDAGNYYIDWDTIDWENDPMDEIRFTNTYTKTVTEPTETTKPTESNPNTGATTSPQTGDNSNLILWLALLAVSAAGVIGTGVYCKRRRNSRAK